MNCFFNDDLLIQSSFKDCSTYANLSFWSVAYIVYELWYNNMTYQMVGL